MRALSVFSTAIMAVTAFLMIGCSSSQNSSQPVVEEYKGTYMVRDTTEVISKAKIDSVTFTIRDYKVYSFNFYDAVNVDFCDCEGSALNFGTNKITFDPTVITSSNCDSLRIPRGVFDADFVTHGDTVYMEKRGTIPNDLAHVNFFQLKLLKK